MSDNGDQGIRYVTLPILGRRAAMRFLKSSLKAKETAGETVIDFREIGRRNLTEYVLNMAIRALAQSDSTPMYEDYMSDPRLTDEDRDELARAYLLLQMASTQTPTID